MMNLPSSITLCEVGLRDGLQNEKTLLSTEDKLELLHGLIDAGFTVIELGSFMHPKAVPQMADTDELYKAIGDVPGVELRALIPNLRGVQRAAACGCKKVKCIRKPTAQSEKPEYAAGRKCGGLCLLRRGGKGKRDRDFRLHFHALCLPVGGTRSFVGRRCDY